MTKTSQGLTSGQVRQFHDDGFLVVRDILPREAIHPLIDELVQKVDELTREAVRQGLLDPTQTFEDAPFATRLALVSDATTDRNWFWEQLTGKPKTAGMFTLRTSPPLLEVVESIIGPEILAHPQFVLRPKLPELARGVVPWHQDLAYLVPKDAGSTLVVTCWVPLVKATVANGCLQVLRRSHRLGLLPHTHHDAGYHGIAEADLPSGDIVTCEMEVGDVLLATERLVHRSIPNTTDTVRWSVDTRYSQLGLPTGRRDTPGFVARSRKNPQEAARSLDDWHKVLADAGLDPQDSREAWRNDKVRKSHQAKP